MTIPVTVSAMQRLKTWPTDMPDDPLFSAAEEQTRVLLRQAKKHSGISIPLGEIRFDLKGKAAGMVVYRQGMAPVVRYNPAMLRACQTEFLTQTLPHEVAHLVTRVLFGSAIRPHGPEWKGVMDFFGTEARRCHNFDIHPDTVRRLRRFSYACACREHRLTSIRHNRILKGQRYLCKRCGATLRALN